MQRQAADAYSRVGTATLPPRELEASLLSRAAARLQAVKDEWDQRRSELDEALTYNRKLWSVFASAATQPDGGLPREVRQNIANLSIFVFNHTLGIQAAPAPAKLAALININRTIAEGLRAPTR
ncbi:MAG: flagellar biosynthesis regulator FlaF [Bauldia sp.]